MIKLKAIMRIVYLFDNLVISTLAGFGIYCLAILNHYNIWLSLMIALFISATISTFLNGD
jgi:hypothetical protein